MRFLSFALPICLGLFAGLANTLPTAQAAPVKVVKSNSIWEADFNKAREKARQLGRPLLVHFYAEWCGPCKTMEREVLGSADLARQLSNRFVAVKINSDKNIAVVEKFGVQSLPTDIFLEPDSLRIISRSEGYQSKSTYLSRVARVDARWAQTRRQHIASSTKPADNGSTQGPQLGGPSLGPSDSGSSAPEIKPIEKPLQSHAEPAVVEPVEEAAPARTGPPANLPNFVGLDGFSPVTLGRERRWVKGNVTYTAEFKGIKYWFADAEEVELFNMYAERFAPRLLGCDPVMLWKDDRAHQGSTQFGAFYAGELYLFVTAENRSEFKQHPERYIRARHVLRDEIEHSGVRRAAVEPEKKSG